MFNDDKLNDIIVADTNTREVYAIIRKDDEVLQKDGFVVILNYSNEDKLYKHPDGKMFWRGEWW